MALLGAQAQTYYGKVQDTRPRFRTFDIEPLFIRGGDPSRANSKVAYVLGIRLHTTGTVSDGW